MNNEKFGVYKEVEVYKKISGYNRYHYECLTDSTLLEVFDNKEDAIQYVDSYTLNVDKYSDRIYADTLSIFEVDECNSIISDNLYVHTYSYEELESMLDITLVVY